MRLSNHAIERYREQYPTATIPQVLLALRWGEQVSSELVQALTCRRRADPTSTYFISPNRDGCFVVCNETSTVITYLRFGTTAQRVLGVVPPEPEAEPEVVATPEPAPVEKVLTEAQVRREERRREIANARAEAHYSQLAARYEGWPRPGSEQ